MIKINQSKIWLLAGLYVTQTLGLGFILIAVPTILRENGASLEEISVVFVVALIWTLKFLWAPLVDRFGSKRYGHYRSWLIVAQSLLIILLIIAAFFDINSQLNILIGLFALIALAAATQDIAADALGVTILAPEERGFGNSIQTMGGFIGSLVGGGVVLITYQWLGWTGSLLMLAAATVVPLMNIWRYDEQPAPADTRTEKVGYRDLFSYFRRPGILRWIGVMITYMLGSAVAYSLVNPMLVDLGWSLERIGFVINIVGALVSVAGAIVAGQIIQRIGRKTTMLIGNVLVVVAIFTLLPAAGGNDNNSIVYSSIGLMVFALGISSTVFATTLMDKSAPSSPGTDYTLQFSLSQVLSLIFSGTMLALAETIQYTGVLWISIGLTILSIVLVWFYNDFEPRRVQKPHLR